MANHNLRQYLNRVAIFLFLSMLFAFSGMTEAAVTLTPRVNASGVIIGDEDYVLFGKFDHRLNTYNGSKESAGGEISQVLWRVMEYDGTSGSSKATLLSHYLLDAMPYETEVTYNNGEYYRGDNVTLSNTWSGSKVQIWLNDDSTGFLKDFTPAERGLIVSDSPDGLSGSKVTLPSFQTSDGSMNGNWYEWVYAEELSRWFGANDVTDNGNTYGPKSKARRAHFKGATFDYDTDDWGWDYWARSPVASGSNGAWDVHGDGTLYGGAVDDAVTAVRPAFFLNLESLIFKSGSDSTKPAAEGGQFSNPFKLYVAGDVDTISPSSTSVAGKTLTLTFTNGAAHAYKDLAAGQDLHTRFITETDGATNPVTVVTFNTTGTVVLALTNDVTDTANVKVRYAAAPATDAHGIAFPGAGTVADSFGDGSINGVSALSTKPTTHTATGGKSMVTVSNVGLTNGTPIKVKASDGTTEIFNDLTIGTTGSDTIELDFPANTTATAKTYAIEVSLDDGATWKTAPTATVTVSGTTPTTPGGDNPGGGDNGGGGGSGKTTVAVDGATVASVSTSGTTVTITWKDTSKLNTTYNLNLNSVTFTYGAGQFTVALNGAGALVITGDGELLPNGTVVVLTATNATTTQTAAGNRAALLRLRKGASYALGEAKAVIANGKCVFTFPAEQVAKLPAGTYDLTFATKSGANPAFKGTFAKGYVHRLSEPAAPEILLDASETTSGGGVQVSATVTSGDAPQGGVNVTFTLDDADAVTRTTGTDGKIAAFTLKSGLANGIYTVRAAANGYAAVGKTVTVSNAPTGGGDDDKEEEKEKVEEKGGSGSGGCDAGAFGLYGAALLCGVFVLQRISKRR